MQIHTFRERHIGTSAKETEEMLSIIGVPSVDALIEKTIPQHIKINHEITVGQAMSEYEYLSFIRAKATENKIYNNFIGMGYYGTLTPTVILRNIFENPGWYTQYTPYQAEISQGRLEALLNYQTMVSELTGMPIANASLLDEATAAAESMHLLHEVRSKVKNAPTANKIFIDQNTFPQTIDVVKGRALPLNIEVVVGDYTNFTPTQEYFSAIVQYPAADGAVNDFTEFFQKCKASNIFTTVIADILSLAILTPPAEFGADIVVGSTQRFGVPMGFGGPHAAYFACKEEFVRLMPGRLIGVSVDKHGNRALRMALQTREQHIKREKATSNICTAQALLAIMAGMYAVYHGNDGIKNIAQEIHNKANALAQTLTKLGFSIQHQHYFDTISVAIEDANKLKAIALNHQTNLWYNNNTIQITIDETTTNQQLQLVADIFANYKGIASSEVIVIEASSIPASLQRKMDCLTHPIFNKYHSEHEMLRYIKRLENKDLSLCHSMISLGSCTMKLNATSEMMPLSLPEFANIHPFVPKNQAQGYLSIIQELENYLAQITGFSACSLQPNSGAQGEYAGLMVIRAYHVAHNQTQRTTAIIPASAHGTNPASAVMAGMDVVVVKTDESGNIDVEDLKLKVEKHKDTLSCLMVTYPSTHGVFEPTIKDICQIIHDNGGLVYMDGANMNAQVGLTSPATIGADVNHINLHKTFAIPHGGGGPGMGPICVNDKLTPYLPKHVIVETGGTEGIAAISAAPYGSASILLISYAYIKMLGQNGIKDATKYAILNANYMKKRLETHFPILYTGENGSVAHEFIIDLRPLKKDSNIDAVDVAKRLMDYNFHAPTVAFPVPGTLMIEPTESENKDELDRFCDAMISIRQEIEDIINGKTTKEDNPIINAPHTMFEATKTTWEHPYSREQAAFPLQYVKENKFWASVGKVDNTYGDRNLVCTCPPMEDYM
ncbi:MAG: aminomethyl-transferring glycine dehydrogenase [Chitinophagales bacterium]